MPFIAYSPGQGKTYVVSVDENGGITQAFDNSTNTLLSRGAIPTDIELRQSTTSATPPMSAAIADVAASAISTVGTTVSAVFSPTAGVSQVFELITTAPTGTPSLVVDVRERTGGGAWTTIYTFPTVTTATTLVSPLLGQNGKEYQYQYTFSGAASSITRAVNRYQSTVSVLIGSYGSGLVAANTQRVVPASLSVSRVGHNVGTIALSEHALPTGSRISAFNVTNESGIVLYFQVHQNASALTSGTSAPVPGVVWRVPNNSSAYEGFAFFGPDGRSYGANMRIALSTTRAVYTAPTLPQITATLLNVETV